MRARPPRYSSLPLPDTAWLPGRGPRPAPRELDPAQAWPYAIDLWNARCFWEAHEVLETLWRAEPARTSERELLQGLIQLAAAHVAAALGRAGGARRLCARGAARLRAVPGRPLGMDPRAVATATEAWLAGRAVPARIALRGVRVVRR